MYICDSNKEIPSYSTKRNWGSFSHLPQKEFATEILAPSSIDSYKNAVYNGADAIFFGYKELNARARGGNFSSLKEVTGFCHLFGVKAYLTLNISLKNNEIDKAKEIIIEAEDANIDAFIISDLALLSVIKKYSKAQVHASTQMGIHNLFGVRFLEKVGFDRVVLSREVTIDEIKCIKNNSDIEVEVFVHGALCVGFSGACLLSSMLTGNSGNRGRCNQLCRQFYTCYINGKKTNEGYLLSAKDVNMLDNLQELKDAKVDSFKIEGRLRRPEYVGGTTNIYQYYNTSKAIPEISDLNTLKMLYNRGDYTTLYFGEKDKIYPFAPGHIGVEFGRIVEVRSTNSAVAKMDYAVGINDGFKITRNKKEVGGGVVITDLGNLKYLIRTDKAVNVGDITLITTDNALNNSIKDIQKKIIIDTGIRIVHGEKPHIIASSQGITVEIYGEEDIPMAKTNPVNKEEVVEQFSKTADTLFEIKFVTIVCDNAFLSKSQLNALRRQLLEKIRTVILENYPRKIKTWGKLEIAEKTEKIIGDFAEFSNDFDDCIYYNIKNIVYNPDNLNYENCLNFYNKTKRKDNLIYIKPPIFVLEKNFDTLKNICSIFDGIVADNLAYITLAKMLQKKVVAGINLNITNTKNPLINLCDSYFASVELNKKELIPFKGALLYTYGKLPLMYLNHCPRLLGAQKCDNCTGDIKYKDNKGEYQIVTKKFLGYCQHILKNGIITNLGNFDGYGKYFDFSNMDNSSIDRVIYNYYVDKQFSTENYNHLHLSRGVN